MSRQVVVGRTLTTHLSRDEFRRFSHHLVVQGMAAHGGPPSRPGQLLHQNLPNRVQGVSSEVQLCSNRCSLDPCSGQDGVLIQLFSGQHFQRQLATVWDVMPRVKLLELRVEPRIEPNAS